MTSTRSFSLAAAVRVIHRVHGHAAIVRLPSQPASLTSFAVGFVLVLDVADLADSGHAFHLYFSDLTGWQFQECDAAFARNQLGLRARGTRHLRTLAGPQFDVVHHGAGRNILERQRVSNQDVRFRARVDRASHFETHRANNVAFLAIGVVQQSNASGEVGIVLYGSNFGGDTSFVPLKVDDPGGLFGAASS